MVPVVSVYLDAVRFAAALVVFLAHVSGQRLTGGLFWQFGPYGSQAVVVFFVLSGFVVAHSTRAANADGLGYAVARASRICSVAVPALALTLVLDTAGSTLRPDLYQAWWGYAGEGRIWQYLSALTFTGRSWWISVTPGSNIPYWSLHYEVWYYAIFGVFLFSPARWRIPATLAAALLAGPPILALLPLWLLGVAAYRACAARPLARGWGAVLVAASLLGWLACEGLVRELGRPTHGAWLNRPEILQDYAVGALFALSILGLHGLARDRRAVPERLAVPVRWVAGATFTLYLTHLPVAQFLAAATPWGPSFWATRLLVIGGTLAAVFLFAAVTERRRDAWRRIIETGLHRLGRLHAMRTA